MKPLPRLYGIADASFGNPILLAQSLLAGGVRLLQIRNKESSAGELVEQVERILSFAPADAQIIVNDRVDVALIAAAAGVHLGQDDLPPVESRRILGNGRIIGISTHNMEQALKADQFPVDYIAVGPIFATRSKNNPDPVVGLETLAAICRSVRTPVVAIGGITLGKARDVLETGAASIAVIRDLLDSPDIPSRVQDWIEVLSANAD